MIPKIKKILYATDLSANANYAFGYALNLAMSNEAKASGIFATTEFAWQWSPVNGDLNHDGLEDIFVVNAMIATSAGEFLELLTEPFCGDVPRRR